MILWFTPRETKRNDIWFHPHLWYLIPFVIFNSIHTHNGGFLNPSFTNTLHQILGVHLSTNCTVSSTNSLLDAYQISGQSVRLFWKYQSPCESEVWSHAMKLYKFNNQQWEPATWQKRHDDTWPPAKVGAAAVVARGFLISFPCQVKIKFQGHMQPHRLSWSWIFGLFAWDSFVAIESCVHFMIFVEKW